MGYSPYERKIIKLLTIGDESVNKRALNSPREELINLKRSEREINLWSEIFLRDYLNLRQIFQISNMNAWRCLH